MFMNLLIFRDNIINLTVVSQYINFDKVVNPHCEK